MILLIVIHTCRRFLTTRKCQGSSPERKSGEFLPPAAATAVKGGTGDPVMADLTPVPLKTRSMIPLSTEPSQSNIKNQLRLMRLKSSGDSGSSSGSSSGQKITISAITTPETAAEKKLKEEETRSRSLVQFIRSKPQYGRRPRAMTNKNNLQGYYQED